MEILTWERTELLSITCRVSVVVEVDVEGEGGVGG